MRKVLIGSVMVMGLILGRCSASGAEDFRHTIGGGIHYWRTIDNIHDDTDFKEDGVAYMVSYQYAPWSLLKLELDGEIFPDGFGGSDTTAYAPQAFILLGSTIYVGAGVGITYSSELEDDWSDPFYQLRAGLDLELLPQFHIDVNANYQFFDWKNAEETFKGIDTDTVTLGAMARLAF